MTHASAIAGEAIQRVEKLYDLGGEIRGQAAHLRWEIRQSRARPLMDDLHLWFHKTLAGLSRKSDTAAAIRYALSRWRALGRYLDDGSIEIDNSAAERAQRVIALGRKNYLFAGSDAGGERAAAIYSLLGSAKLNDLDPELYTPCPGANRRSSGQLYPRTPTLEPGLTASNASRSISSVHLKIDGHLSKPLSRRP